MDELRAAISAGNERFMAGFRRGDAAEIATCYTKTARLLPPNRPMITGTQGIKEFWQGEMNLRIKERELVTIEVESRINLAVEVGEYRLTIDPENGQTMTDSGKYTVVWKMDGGHWRMHIDIWNTSSPA